MSKADVITCHPRDVYYPFWVYQMNKNRELFGRIIVMMTQTSSNRDYTQYLKSHLNNGTIIEKYEDRGIDWRNAAINKALKYIVSPSVLFLEQDFLVKEDFFRRLLEQGETHNAVGFRDNARFHPACFLVKKEIIDKTNKDFSANPPTGDHFSIFSDELINLGEWTTLEELDLPDWYHLAGLTQNYRLATNFFKPRQFYTYNQGCLMFEQPDEWRRFCKKKQDELTTSGEAIWEDKNIKSFFEEI